MTPVDSAGDTDRRTRIGRLPEEFIGRVIGASDAPDSAGSAARRNEASSVRSSARERLCLSFSHPGRHSI